MINFMWENKNTARYALLPSPMHSRLQWVFYIYSAGIWTIHVSSAHHAEVAQVLRA